MVEWPRTVNPVLKKRNRFESYHLHQICRGSSLGRAPDCLSDLGGFDSRPRRQIYSAEPELGAWA